MPADRPRPTGLVIWFHGLGDTGQGWRHLVDQLGPRLPWLRWQFPDAPQQPVSCNSGARMSSWFDLKSIPVSHGEYHDGLAASVAHVHRLLEEAKKDGISPSRVVLGGFSQGACLSLHAALTAREPIAGACALSGWVAGSTENMRNPNTPILMCHGTADPIVPFPSGQRSSELLRRGGCANLRFKEYRGMEHSSSPEEFADVLQFLLSALPQVSADVPLDQFAGISVATKASLAPQLNATVPTHRSLLQEDGRCRIEVDIPSLDGVQLDVSETELRLSGRYSLTTAWPSPIDTSQSKAKFDSKKQRLVVRARSRNT